MLKSFWTGAVVAAVLCLTLNGGVAAADPSDPSDPFDPDNAGDCSYQASPNPGKLDNVSDCKETADHNWRLHVSLKDVSITSVPNMAATAFTREAFVSATATVSVEAVHPDDPTPEGADVLQRSVALFLQLGCQAIVNGNTVTAGDTPSTSLAGSASSAGTTSGTTNVADSTNPQDSQSFAPGTITTRSLQYIAWPPKAPDLSATPTPATPTPATPTPPRRPPPPGWVTHGWKDDTLTVSVLNDTQHVDNCAGPVSLRFFGAATLQAPRYNVDVNAYGDIVQV